MKNIINLIINGFIYLVIWILSLRLLIFKELQLKIILKSKDKELQFKIILKN